MENEFKYYEPVEVTKGDGSEDSVSGYYMEGYSFDGYNAGLWDTEPVELGEDVGKKNMLYWDEVTVENFVRDYIKEFGIPGGIRE
jgi:hypothetical protein